MPFRARARLAAAKQRDSLSAGLQRSLPPSARPQGTLSRGTAVVGLQPYWSTEGTRALVAPRCHRGDVWPGLWTRHRCTQSCAYRCTREVTHSSQGKSGVEGRVTLGARSTWPPHTEGSSSMWGTRRQRTGGTLTQAGLPAVGCVRLLETPGQEDGSQRGEEGDDLHGTQRS